MDRSEDSNSLALRLDLSPGDIFRSKVHENFCSSVCPSSPYHGFSLVISFGRANFNLNNTNVGLALSACLGDPFDSFRVACLRDRVYIFDVCSKEVGFMICNLKSYSCKDFVCFSISGAMADHIGKEKNSVGILNKTKNGLWYDLRQHVYSNPDIKMIHTDPIPMTR
jgi:hypothetical protein